MTNSDHRDGAVVAGLSMSAVHSFSKQRVDTVELIAGLGIAGDAHAGATVQHRSRVARDPSQPNLRQVHLVHGELLGTLATQGFAIAPGDIGENVLTRGVDLLSLPRGALLRLGQDAVVEVTGLRNPCHQLDDFRPGLMQATLGRDAQGKLVLKAGVMAVVIAGGIISVGDDIEVELPAPPHFALQRV